jgi:hypothetical protein
MMKHARLRGIRQQLHWHDKAAGSRPGPTSWTTTRGGGAGEVARRDLFELQVFAGQVEAARWSGTSAGDLRAPARGHAGGYEPAAARWRAGMRAPAAPNLW